MALNLEKELENHKKKRKKKNNNKLIIIKLKIVTKT